VWHNAVWVRAWTRSAGCGVLCLCEHKVVVRAHLQTPTTACPCCQPAALQEARHTDHVVCVVENVQAGVDRLAGNRGVCWAPSAKRSVTPVTSQQQDGRSKSRNTTNTESARSGKQLMGASLARNPEEGGCGQTPVQPCVSQQTIHNFLVWYCESYTECYNTCRTAPSTILCRIGWSTLQ
jgi:hypothetical protein